jgi:GntR family carbon starvation induced transcriptional regulator
MERTHTSTVYNQIRSDIINGNLAANTKLNMRNLAARFEVGLSPIREALSRLSSEGWAVQSDRRGFTVVAATSDELWDLHRARCSLNEVCLRESIQYGGVDWEEGVLLSYIRISRLQRPADMAATEEAEHWNLQHRAFHSSLINACRSQRLVRYCEQLFDEIERYRRIGLSHNSIRANIADEHQQIANAAVARDGELAVQLLNQQFNRTVEHVDQALRALQKKPGNLT